MAIFDSTTRFLNPQRLLFGVGLQPGQTLVDFGTGSGFYAVAAGKIVGEQGTVCSVDVLESALDHVAAEARLNNLHNIKTVLANLEVANSCSTIPTGGADLALMANIAHQLKKPENMFAEAYRVLKTGGHLMVIEWNDQPSPLGPPIASRVDENKIINLAAKASFKPVGDVTCDPYHYGLVFIK